MTCNPQWGEIMSQLRPGQDFSDIPVVICRVCKQRVVVLMNALSTMFHSPGRREYLIERIKFQKCRLPHMHISIKFQKNCATPGEIDFRLENEDTLVPTMQMWHYHARLLRES